MSAQGELGGLCVLLGYLMRIPCFSSEEKHTTRVAAGLKASINNPNVSEDARERAADRLESIEGANSDQHQTRQLAGYKATLHSERTRRPCIRAATYLLSYADDRTSAQAKEHAREVLEAAGYTVEPGPGLSPSEHQTHVLAGYKAALHSKWVITQSLDEN